MKTFKGARTIDGIRVSVDDRPLDENYGLKRFTTRGFEWTYEGDEPSQLALAILAEHLGDDQKSLENCDAFMKAVVANLDNDWELTSEDIDKALAEIAGA
ncbi:MAG: DUF6166 domain-containing protein [Rhodospirillales bacterium]|jgi:hypothetical protein|nr:DUF6166 domain-containing protein [Rhodospirillales bacterium]|tara:strand:- start:16 stop:315 length:300 start_codon:yes stop_codon:yes gene_type:complete